MDPGKINADLGIFEDVLLDAGDAEEGIAIVLFVEGTENPETIPARLPGDFGRELGVADAPGIEEAEAFVMILVSGRQVEVAAALGEEGPVFLEVVFIGRELIDEGVGFDLAEVRAGGDIQIEVGLDAPFGVEPEGRLVVLLALPFRHPDTRIGEEFEVVSGPETGSNPFQQASSRNPSIFGGGVTMQLIVTLLVGSCPKDGLANPATSARTPVLARQRRSGII